MKHETLTTRELLEQASDLSNQHDFLISQAHSIKKELEKRKISKKMKKEFDYTSIIDDLDYITA